MKDFKKLIVWQKSMDLLIDIHKMTKKLPIEERFEMAAQVRRSAFSIPANIAEGSARLTSAQYRQFLEYSLGSAYETETALLAIARLYEFLKPEVKHLLERLDEIQRMITAFVARINSAKASDF
jgi:four helix bundle protein